MGPKTHRPFPITGNPLTAILLLAPSLKRNPATNPKSNIPRTSVIYIQSQLAVHQNGGHGYTALPTLMGIKFQPTEWEQNGVATSGPAFPPLAGVREPKGGNLPVSNYEGDEETHRAGWVSRRKDLGALKTPHGAKPPAHWKHLSSTSKKLINFLHFKPLILGVVFITVTLTFRIVDRFTNVFTFKYQLYHYLENFFV